MRSFFCSVVLLAMVVLSATAGAWAREARVDVVVHCEQDALRNVFKSKVSGHLRALSDVKLTSNDPQFRFHLIPNQVEVDGDELGVVLFVVITQPVPRDALKPPAIDPAGFPEELKQLISASERLLDFYSALGSKDEVAGECEQFVANFDVGFLEPLRSEDEGQ